jgi:hypothetical protein
MFSYLLNGLPYTEIGYVGRGLFGTGTAAAPSISFSGDPDTGFFNSPGAVVVSSNGVACGYFTDYMNGGFRVAAYGTNKPLWLQPNGTGPLQIGPLTFASVGPFIQFSNDAGTTIGFFNMLSGSFVDFGSYTNHGVRFYSNAQERMRLNAAGGLTMAAGNALQLGNAAVAGAVVPTHSVTIKDSAGVTYRVPCLV